MQVHRTGSHERRRLSEAAPQYELRAAGVPPQSEERGAQPKGEQITATGRIEIDFERCKACELCVPACPKRCIGMGTPINRQGYGAAVFERPDDCTGCAICAETCPDACILVWR